MSFVKSLIYHILLTAILWFASFGLAFIRPEYIHTNIHWIFLFFLIQSLGIAGLNQFALKAADQMPAVVLSGVVLRLLTTIFFFVFAIIFEVEESTKFILNTTIIYLPYLIFEIILLLPNLRPNSEKN